MTAKVIRTATFSIVAHERRENSWGVAVASKFLAVGGLVPFARAGVGAVATQSLANLAYGEQGLEMMAGGLSAAETLKRLVEGDDLRESRQAGIVDAKGEAATFTGDECLDWAGGVTGAGYAIQGNILAGEQVITDMVAAFEGTEGELADRLYAALLAGDRAGGDRRGKQSASLLVVKPHGSYGGATDRYLDLRVDDHGEPVEELGRLLRLHRIFLGTNVPEEMLKIDREMAAALQAMLQRRAYYDGPVNGAWDGATREAFERFVNTENLEERVDIGAGLIHPLALGYIREHFMGGE